MQANQWRERMRSSAYICRQSSRWIKQYVSPDSRFPERIFRETFGVPRPLFHRLLVDPRAQNEGNWTTKYLAIGSEGIYAAVTVVLCLKCLSNGVSLRERNEGAQMGKENIRTYMKQIFHDVK